MSVKSFISKEVFVPCDERLLGIVQVKRRMGKKIPFLATGGLGDYKTYICLSGGIEYPSTIGELGRSIQTWRNMVADWADGKHEVTDQSSGGNLEFSHGVSNTRLPFVKDTWIFNVPSANAGRRDTQFNGHPRDGTCTYVLPCLQNTRVTVYSWVKTQTKARHLRVRNKRPSLRFITKVKHFEGSGTFVRRSQWALEQLRQVNGVESTRECPEFDLLFDNAYDLWVASSSVEKRGFLQLLYVTCSTNLPHQPSFVNCQAQIIGGNSILHTAADSVTSAVQKASQALNERGERLGRADQRTAEMANSAHKFAETAHKLASKYKN